MAVSKAKKFIAILGEEDMGDGTSTFYIVDEDFYKKEGCVSDKDYMPEVYDAIEQLGRNCWLCAENCFSVDGVMKGGEAGLRRFLKPLNWIVVESDYLNGAKIQEFKNTNKNLVEEIKKLNSPNVIFLNNTDGLIKNIHFKLYNNSTEVLFANEIKKGLNFINKQLDSGKFVAIAGDNPYYVYTYNNINEYSQIMQKAQEIKDYFLPAQKPPENAPASIKIASELKMPYFISNSEEEIDKWEKLANQYNLTTIRGKGLIFAYEDMEKGSEFIRRLLKTKKVNQMTLLRNSAKKLNIPYFICKNREDFENMQSKLANYKDAKVMLQIGDTMFAFKNDAEMNRLQEFALLDEDDEVIEGENTND